MSIKSIIEKSVRERQRGVRVSKGDQFWRGLELIYVTDVKGGKISFESVATGGRDTVERKDFITRGLIRGPRVTVDLGSFIERAWAIAGTKGLPMRYRFQKTKKLLKDSPSREDTERINNWLYALSIEKEPKK